MEDALRPEVQSAIEQKESQPSPKAESRDESWWRKFGQADILNCPKAEPRAFLDWQLKYGLNARTSG